MMSAPSVITGRICLQQPQPAQTRAGPDFTQRDHPPDEMSFLYGFKGTPYGRARPVRLQLARSGLASTTPRPRC
jgi:hypothetical protein